MLDCDWSSDVCSSDLFPAQWFAWSAAFLAEQLVEAEGIDVIEAQEWEAPLYYFLLRRSLGLGPDRKPPCVVHLHSPSEFIHHYNCPAVAPAALPAMMRMEDYCIRSADALLCPSKSLAADAGKRFQFSPEKVRVIPLPVGAAPFVERNGAVWEKGSICFVGRLEPRKGIIEWVDAAARVARRNPAVHFDFVGADIWNLQSVLVEQIGADLAPRFRFHGAKSKEGIQPFLAAANAAVVPSRWENFPNVCIEAMSSGLPVIATRYGGMAEMIEDGESGWLAEDYGVAGLADSLEGALERCLATPAETKAAMGGEASAAVRRFCDNDAIVEAHRTYRAKVAQDGASTSLGTQDKQGVAKPANVVVLSSSVDEASPVLRSIAAQSFPAQSVVLVHRTPASAGIAANLEASGVRLHYDPAFTAPQGWNDGAASLQSDPDPGFWVFLDQADRLEPDCLARMASIFAARPDVGIVSPWTLRGDGAPDLDARPSPMFPHQLTGNDVVPASGFRNEAIASGPPFRRGFPREYDIWALSNDVIAKGWVAVTVPALLARRAALPDRSNWVQDTALRAIRAQALAAFADEGNRVALGLVDGFVPLGQRPRATPRDKPLRRRLVRGLEILILHPGEATRRGSAFVKRRLATIGIKT
jgi:glycosyltransferase involved in cell wall biosynthesis